MAATACWGTQQVGIWESKYEQAKYDGVFAIWYGKGPGVDRSGDALKHGNLAGTSANGGVLVLAGDDRASVCLFHLQEIQNQLGSLYSAYLDLLKPKLCFQLYLQHI